MNKIIGFSLTLFTFLTLSQSAYALPEQKLAFASARLSVEKNTNEVDRRSEVLKNFLTKYNSPLAEKSDYIVQIADENEIDYRLLVAISGVESTFANAYPNGSYNAWGWGGSNLIYFSSWDDSIATISKSLRERYIDRIGSDDVYSIGRIYAASPTWGSRVENFMNKIEESDNKISDISSIALAS